MHYIQTSTRPVHSRLVIPEQPYRKWGPGNHWHEYKPACHQHIGKYTSMHINRRHTGNNPKGHRPPESKSIHNTRLATKKTMSNRASSIAGQLEVSWQWYLTLP